MGVVIDGCPAGLEIDERLIGDALQRRAPGIRALTSPRMEPDKPEILSGIFEGKTSGAPLCILIRNRDADSTKYDPLRHLLRPGHANYTYLQKYGCFDHRGGGRASARETACRVAAGAVARKFLDMHGIGVVAYLKQVEDLQAALSTDDGPALQRLVEASPLFWPDPASSDEVTNRLSKTQAEGDSLAGIVEFHLWNVPPGLGDPVYEKLDARLAFAMMGLPATKGFEIGSGFNCATMRGSEHNDLFCVADDRILTQTNHAGGILGGISNGMPIVGRVAFKAPSSIKAPQKTIDMESNLATFQLPEGSRHDPCVAIRAVPVVEAMCCLVLADALLMQRSAQVSVFKTKTNASIKR